MTILTTERDNLILDNLTLAEKLARSKKRKLTHISYDELKSAAYLGLVQAANNYNPSENDCFPAFAIWRIIGAIRDYLRELSWGSRSNLIKMEYEYEISSNEIVSVDVTFENLIQELPIVNKTVLKLYYQEGMKIREIAGDLNVHQSRISQILTDSKSKLRHLWQDHQGELWISAA